MKDSIIKTDSYMEFLYVDPSITQEVYARNEKATSPDNKEYKKHIESRIYDWIMSKDSIYACIYGRAYHRVDTIIRTDNSVALYELLEVISEAIRDNAFFQTGYSDKEIFDNFCHLFYVDPYLLKAFAECVLH